MPSERYRPPSLRIVSWGAVSKSFQALWVETILKKRAVRMPAPTAYMELCL